MKKTTDLITILLTASVCLCGVASFFAAKPREYSEAERRRLADIPDADFGSISDGSYFSDLGIYLTEHFPCRDGLRQLRAFAERYILLDRDCDNIIEHDGYLSQSDTANHSGDAERTADIINRIVGKYLGGSRCVFSVIPDKTAYLTEYGYYDTNEYIISEMKRRVTCCEYADITPFLSLNDYYRTDTHWSQDRITDIADYYGEVFGVDVSSEYDIVARDGFYGVLAPQYALPTEPDTLYYLTDDVTDGCTVYDYETGRTLPVYDADAADMYDTFLHGTRAMLRIDNSRSESGRELIIFRDSFASSLAPLLCRGYDRITLIDLRYVGADDLREFVDFHGQDVLFLYSTIVIRQSRTLAR